jgi:hypothetical protein
MTTTMASFPTALIESYDDWEGVYTIMSLYGVHIVIGTLLYAVTFFRREMSCNRVFHEEEDEQSDASSLMKSDSFDGNDDDDDGILEMETEELLDRAGLYCSGQPIFSFASQWLMCFPGESTNHDDDIEPTSKLLFCEPEDMTPSELLDRAGNFCSGEPLLAAHMALCLLLSSKTKEEQKKTKGGTSSTSTDQQQQQQQEYDQYDPFTNDLPPDVHVHIASFLHPKDVVTLSCVSKSYRRIVNDDDDSSTTELTTTSASLTSRAIWKTLWQRDYAWIVEDWHVGQAALLRSNPSHANLCVDKEFYFSFGYGYMNYLLAGQNTAQQCLVGLHSHIYDITHFLDAHPGSPDTLMVYAGMDSTRFFEDMGHSMVARRLAKKLCVVADMSSSSASNGGGGWGLRPTQHTALPVLTKTNHPTGTTTSGGDNDNDTVRVVVSEAGDNLLLGRKQRPWAGTLQRIRNRLEKEREQVQRRLDRRYVKDSNVLGQVHPYYDPFLKEWRVWYTDANLQTVFLPA